MKKSKQTKRALIPSLLAVILCVAMLVGTTFAWFTDTASTSVNKIQAGTLDVALEMKNPDHNVDGKETKDQEWISAEGKTLEFKKAANAPENEAVLWEPGCTYELPELRISNNGNLALKYKVVITGIQGSAKLNKVIDWTIKNDANDADSGATNLSTTEYHLTAKGGNNASDILTISGTMKTTAGNEYQGESIDGIGITVIATQDTAEFDSNNNTYDEKAQYPVVAVSQVEVDSTSKKTTTNVTIKSAETVSETDATPLATAIVPADVLTTSEDGATSTQLKLTIDKTAVPANFTYNVDEQDAKTLEVKMTNLSSENSEPITVKMYVGKELSGFKLYHNSVEMTAKGSAEAVTDDQTYYYDSTTGFVTMATATFSPFTYLCKKPVGVSTFEEFTAALEKAKAGDTIRLDAIITVNNFTFDKSIIIDMNGYGFVRAREASGGYGIKVLPDCDLTMRNGSWTIAENAGFGNITVENAKSIDASNTENNIVFENVRFINLKPASGSVTTNAIEEVVRVNMQSGMTVNATFTDCTFKNAKVYFSTFNSGTNNFKAVFEGCTFNNLGNTSTIEEACLSNCTGTSSIKVNNCTFNITSTSGVTIVNSSKWGQNVDLIFTNNNVTGAIADGATYRVSSSASVKVHSGTGDRGFKSVTYDGNTLTGCATEK